MSICRAALLGLFLTAGLSASSAQAAITWDGGGSDDLLTTKENWDGDEAPTTGTNQSVATGDIVFSASAKLTPETSIANQGYRSIIFDQDAGAYVFGGTETLSFGRSGGNTTNGLVNDSSNTQTFNVPVTGYRTNVAANGGDLVFNEVFGIGGTGGNPVALLGSKNIYFNGGLKSVGSRNLDLAPGFTGTAYIPVASEDFTTGVGVHGGTLEIADSLAIGGGGAGSSIGFNGGTTGTLVLTNNINVAKESIWFGGRTEATPQIINKSGINSISGNFVEGGSVLDNATSANHTIESQVGFLALTGPSILTQPESGTGGLNGILTFTGDADGSVSNNIIEADGNTWTVVKDGDGDWTFLGTNNYSGTTTVKKGTLIFNGSHTGGNFIVESNATLSGGGAIEANVIVNPDGILAPGNTPGMLSINGDVTLNGIVSVEIADPSADLLAVTGSVTLGGSSVLDLLIDDIDPLTTYDLITATEGIDGTFGSLVVPVPDSHVLVYSTNVISLVPVPEPSPILLAGSAFTIVGIFLHRKRMRA